MPKDSTNHNLDRILHSAVGKATGGLSPSALSTAWLDWALHVVGSPERQIELAFSAWAKGAEAWTTLLTGKAPETDDPRFQSPAWDVPPYNQLRHWFSLQEAWWQEATAPIVGVDPAHQRIVSFAARQIIDTMSPANFALTNPDVLDKTLAEHGQNFVQGWQHWIEDFNQLISQRPKVHPDYRVGETIAITPGDVVYQNQLIELIRYRPTTKKVHAEPILIVPAWIMKYYILDLSPQNSLVAYLRDQGFEVYIISWKNPDKGDADLSLEDYLDLGLFAAINHIAPNDGAIHAVGYCLGGTLLAAGAAAMARDHDTRLRSLSLLAAQVDFSEPGELSLFINENQVAFLEDIMATQGYLRADQMAGAFRMLRSTDLIWSRIVRHYLLGERTPMNDLMAWNADATRMPARMHSDYLRQMFLENQLAKGRFKMGGKTVALTDLRVPIFCLATETDHVSPWRSVFRLQMLTDTDVTFCLTAGGHNSGVLSEPGHRNRHYRLRKKTEGDPHTAAETWMDQAPIEDGSWWPAWVKWLADHSSAKQPAPAKKRWTKGPAPGRYVFG